MIIETIKQIHSLVTHVQKNGDGFIVQIIDPEKIGKKAIVAQKELDQATIEQAIETARELKELILIGTNKR
jgi:hypothetical protein